MPITLGQKERGKSVAVHRTVAAGIGHVDETALLGIRQDKVDTALDIAAVAPTSGRTTAGKKRHAGRRGNRDVAAVAPQAKRAVLVLPRAQQVEPALNNGITAAGVINSAAVFSGSLGWARAEHLVRPKSSHPPAPRRGTGVDRRRDSRCSPCSVVRSPALPLGQDSSPTGARRPVVCNTSRSSIRIAARTAPASAATLARDRGFGQVAPGVFHQALDHFRIGTNRLGLAHSLGAIPGRFIRFLAGLSARAGLQLLAD